MTLQSVRQGVADALNGAGLNASYTVPDRPAPPLVVVQPGEPYVDETAVAGQTIYEMTLRVTVIVATGTNEKTMNDLDDGISKVIVGLKEQQWSVRVGEPYALVIGATEYPAVDITITNYVEIN